MTATPAAASTLRFTINNVDDTIHGLKIKNEDAFRRLYDKYSGALFARILQATRERSSAEDILQNVFVKTWLNIGTFDQAKGSLYTWMLNICRNEIVDHFRKQNSQKRQIDQWYAKSLYSGTTESGNERIDAAKLMGSLTMKDRAMIDLIYFRGFTYSQAATILQIPAGTLKTRVRTLLKNWRNEVAL